MAREKELFWDNMQRLNERFPEKEVLTKGEVAEYLGVSQRTVTRHYAKEFNLINNTYISKAKLARILS